MNPTSQGKGNNKNKKTNKQTDKGEKGRKTQI